MKLDGLPLEISADLETLESLDGDELRCVLLETVPAKVQQEIYALLRQQQLGPLSETEQWQLEVLQQQADLVMLRKARAAVLLRFRGHRLPSLAELSRLTGFTH